MVKPAAQLGLWMTFLCACEQEPPPPPRTPADEGTVVIHGTVWPGMRIIAGGGYRTTGDIDACRESNWPSSESRPRSHGVPNQRTVADEEGRFRLAVHFEAPEDEGRCQWQQNGGRIQFQPAEVGSAVSVLWDHDPARTGPPRPRNVDCYSYTNEYGSGIACVGGSPRSVDLGSLGGGTVTLEVNIRRVDEPPPHPDKVGTSSGEPDAPKSATPASQAEP